MKTLLIIVGGLGLAVVMLMTGAVGATMFFRSEPERALSAQSADFEVWTSKPAKIDALKQNFARLPARVVSLSGTSTDTVSPELIDASQSSDRPADTATEKLEGAAKVSAAHIAWCADRFRSYRAYDNTYTSYRGVKRQCQSPYGLETAKPASPTETDQPIIEASLVAEYQPVVGARLPMEHVRSCLSRYRSYRPEDNSYQPFNGGPRRQCN